MFEKNLNCLFRVNQVDKKVIEIEFYNHFQQLEVMSARKIHLENRICRMYQQELHADRMLDEQSFGFFHVYDQQLYKDLMNCMVLLMCLKWMKK